MNKKTQKGLVAAITATMGAGIVAPAAMAAVDPVAAARQAVERLESAEKYQNAKEIEACRALVKNLTDAKAKQELTVRINRVMLGEYTEATNAVKKAKETRTQKDVTAAYNEAVNLTNDDAVRKNALINALNVVQKELYTKVDKALAKAETELKQEYLNEAQDIIKDMLNPWRKPREAKYTQLQVKLYVNTRTALQTAKNSGLKSDYEIAKALYEDVKLVRNNNTVAGWVKNVLTPLFESIVLDSTNPVVTGVEEGKAYNTAVTPASEEKGLTSVLTRNGEAVTYTLGEEITEEGVYVLNVYDANKNVTTLHFTIDMTAPVFKYTGETTINVKYGEVFTLPTVEASELSAVITPVITDENDKVVEKIDTKVPGIYTVTYIAVDAAGNQTELVLTVVVAKTTVKVESVSAVTNTNTFAVTLAEEVKAADLTGKKLVLTPAKGTAVEATFKSLEGKVATFEFAAATAEGEYVVTGENFEIAAGTKVVYDKTAPTLNATETKFVDYKTIKVTFSEKVSGTPVVKINGVAEKAENVALAADGMSLTITKTAGYTQGLYTVTINGLADVAKNAMMADANINIRKDASVVNEFKFTTTGVSTAAGNKVYFTLVDQYGLDVTATQSLAGLSAEAVMNNLPLQVSAVQRDQFGAYITITDALVENAIVKVTLLNKDSDNKVVATSVSPEYTVSKYVATASQIVGIKSAKTEAPSGTTLQLTADIRDQYNNPAVVPNGTITWTTSDISVVGLPGGKSFEKGNSTITVNAGSVGTAQVKAFLANGTEVVAPLTITVTEGELNTITPQVAALQVINNKVSENADVLVNIDPLKYPAGTDYVEFKNAQSKNISVKAADVELSVTTAGKDASAEVIFEKVADANGNLTGIKIRTNRTDVTTLSKTYTVTAKVGEKTATFGFDSIIEQVVKTIEVADVAQNGLTTNKDAVVPVTFKNQFGEKVAVEAQQITASQLTNLDVILGTVDADGNFVAAAAGTTKVTHVQYHAKSASANGTYSVFFAVGNATLQKSVTVVPAGVISGMTLGTSNASVIKDDTLDAATPSVKDDVVVVGGFTYKLVPVSFVDNYGNVINVAKEAISKAGDDNLAIEYFTDAQGNYTGAVKYIGVRENNLTDATAQRNITFEIKDANSKVIASSNLLVDVKAARTLDHLVVDKASASAVVNAVSSFKVSGVDQYGRPSNIGALTLDNNYSGALAYSNEAVDGANVTFDLSANKAGSYVAKLKYTVGQEVKSVDIALNVGEIGTVINKLEISPIVNNYDSSKYQVKFVSGTTQVAALAYDANGNDVALNAGDVKYYVESVGMRADYTRPTITVDENTGILTSANVLDGDKVVVRATSKNGKTATMTITLGVAASKAQAGTYFMSTDVDGYVDGKEVNPLTSLELKDDNNEATNDAVANLHVIARDQYGKLFDVDENAFVIGQDSSEYFSAVSTDTNADTKNDTVVITGKAEGTSTVRVFLNGNQITTITITVNKDVIKAQ